MQAIVRRLLLASLFVMSLASGMVLAADPPAAAAPAATTAAPAEAPAFSFGQTPIAAEEIVQLPPPKPAWMTVGGPAALFAFFFLLCYAVYRFIPFRETSTHFRLRDLPVAAQRGIGMAVILFGIAFMFGAWEVHYQLGLHGNAEAWFQQMSIGHLIVMTHVHMFGFTTSFFIIGIPFSLHFWRSRIYQWIFPLGLAASLCDIVSWWGMKYVSPNFEYVTWFCGAVFSISYLWMLIGLTRVIFFPRFHWFPRVLGEDAHSDARDDG